MSFLRTMTNEFKVIGSSDVVQLKVIADDNQTNDTIQVLASDGITKLFSVNNTGDVNISKTSPEFRLTDGEYSRLVRNSVTNSLILRNRTLTPLGGYGLNFVTGNSEKITTGKAISTYYGPSGDFTIALWVRPSGSNTNYSNWYEGQGIFGDTGGWTGVCRCQFSGTDYIAYGWGTAVTNYSISTTYNSGEWNCIIVRRVSGVYTIYNKTKGTSGTSGVTSDYGLGTQVSEFGKGYSSTRYFNGDLDEFATWKRALTDSEINDYYNNGSGLKLVKENTFPSTGTSIGLNLTSLFHFDENAGSTAIDSSANAFNGTLVNTPTYIEGKVGGSNPIVEVDVLTAVDSATNSIKGLITIGDRGDAGVTNFGSKTVLEGNNIALNLQGSPKVTLTSAGMSQTLPHIISGSSDTIQLKVVSNSTQTANLMAIYASDGATVVSTISNSGVLTLKDGGSIVPSANTTGLKLGGATTDKLGHYGVTPIVQPANTVAIDSLLVNTGLRATGGTANFATTISTRAGTATAGTAPLKFTSGSLLTVHEAGAIEFLSDDYYATITTGAGVNPSFYPPAFTSQYVTATTYYPNGGAAYPYRATDPSNTLIGNWDGASWVAALGTIANQAFHIDLGSAKSINRIYYENNHWSGTFTNGGARNFTLWGSNTAGDFSDTVYANNGTWVQITDGLSQTAFDQHSGLNQADPKYITLNATSSYRYYRFKFADNWGHASWIGVRRIELQQTLQNARKVIPLLDNGNLVSGRVPVATTNGRLTDSSNLTFNGTDLTVAGNVSANAITLTTTLTEGSYATDKFLPIVINGITYYIQLNV